MDNRDSKDFKDFKPAAEPVVRPRRRAAAAAQAAMDTVQAASSCIHCSMFRYSP